MHEGISLENKIEPVVFSSDLVEKMKEHFPCDDLRVITSDEIPEDVLKHFEDKSAMFIHPDKYKPLDFKDFGFVDKGERGVTYIATQDKIYDENNAEEISYFVDKLQEHFVGYAELRFILKHTNLHFSPKPFVGYTRTKEGFQGKGYGKERLKLLNAFAFARYERPLYSDVSVTPEAIKVWEKLIAEGKAQKIEEGNHTRYHFI